MPRALFALAGLGVGLATLAACTLPEAPEPEVEARVIHADIVALDQPLTYNRFGSFNPYGMIYALADDVVATETGHPIGPSTCPGEVRLRDGKRPRPLVLRGNAGDTLQVHFTNRLRGQPSVADCSWDTDVHANLQPARRLAEAAEVDEPDGLTPAERVAAADSTNFPITRTASFVASGLTAIRGRYCDEEGQWLPATSSLVTGIEPIQPGECFIYEYALGSEGTHLFFSLGAPSGGQGDGGSLTHGLFGAVNVQPEGSRWYRSQVTAEILAAARGQATAPALIDFEALDASGKPLLNMLRARPGEPGFFDLLYGDLNAIVVDCDGDWSAHRRCSGASATHARKQPAFREFTVIFHDELKTFYPEAIAELGAEYQLEGVGDGFAINYGASGMGSILLANRKGFGPAADCLECLYEEFFLTSWANGDPALLVEFADDPANVHHSYLGDRVEFRNLHAGPKETHVFHLHAHQWLAQRSDEPEREFGSYLDSQTIAPQQGFAYEIYHGGSGNRNQTPGDSIFHCHLYPHFAQGMWALWRTHDVFEDGTRRLPDGELGPGTDRLTGEVALRIDEDGAAVPSGTPIPAIVPLPGQAMPPMPTYAAELGVADAMPGYPFYIPATPGHRAPQPPMDFATDDGGTTWADGGLPRHIFTGQGTRGLSGLSAAEIAGLTPEQAVQYALRTGDFSGHLETAEIKLLDNAGEPIERAAMRFHAGEAGQIRLVDGQTVTPTAGSGYRSVTPEGRRERFFVNSAPPRPGAPFADPCRADLRDGGFAPEREIRYDVAAIQLDLVVNRAGWHDPQARINVLASEAERLEGRRTGEAEPFFFRAQSGDCIEFRHTNRTPKDLELDDFQVKTPTDVIGQHIHLVKFDVMASDGSANGFNYEDGTLAPDAVVERIEAAQAFAGAASGLATPTGATFQTTVQRWYADPLVSGGGADRTLRTVFTHDHFAASSIQQHGFYSALLIEPKGSTWRTADGRVMCVNEVGSTAACAVPAVGAAAIVTGGSGPGHADAREFALAVADFALLYAPETDERPVGPVEEAAGLDHLVARLRSAGVPGVGGAAVTAARNELVQHRDAIRQAHGVPVAPPLKPEAISKNHHDPYLVNYKNEPLPLRVGIGGPAKDASCVDGREVERRRSIDRQKPGDAGDMAFVFSSDVHDDPCTPLIEGYAGERIQVRMIQGAQEVQHMFEIQGMHWKREVANPDSPLVAAQEIGISEHFEMNLPALQNVDRGAASADYLYRFSTVDDMWNGAWGLVRAYDRTAAADQTAIAELPACNDVLPSNDASAAPADCRIGNRLASVEAAAAAGRRADVDRTRDDFGLVPSRKVRDSFVQHNVCPAEAKVRLHVVDAVDLFDWGGRHLLYNRHYSIADWDALAYVPVHSTDFGGQVTAGDLRDVGLLETLGLNDTDDGAIPPLPQAPYDAAALWQAIAAGRDAARAAYAADPASFEPMVLRARAGECIIVRLANKLVPSPADRVRDNDDVEPHLRGEPGYDPRHLPRIVPLNAVELQASNKITLLPQFVHTDAVHLGGVVAGYNEFIPQLVYPGQVELFYWYAGIVEAVPSPGEPGTVDLLATPKAFGPANLVSMGDAIEHGQQGLIGALIIEAADATFVDPVSGEPAPTGTSAVVTYTEDGKRQRVTEHVLIYQDGLNLRRNSAALGWQAEAIPDCLVCDDSYDRGEKAVNYRTEPFWARLGVHPSTDLNGQVFPPDFFLASHKPIATPSFTATAGDEVVFHVVQPYGRARQRAFMVLGHDYEDLLPQFGSPHSALISTGKAFTARLDGTRRGPDAVAGAQVGSWLWRDGPAQHVASGVWGGFEVRER